MRKLLLILVCGCAVAWPTGCGSKSDQKTDYSRPHDPGAEHPVISKGAKVGFERSNAGPSEQSPRAGTKAKPKTQ